MGVDAAADDRRGRSSTTILLDATDRDAARRHRQRVDWTQAAAVARARRVVLAGGLSPENVEAAIERCGPRAWTCRPASRRRPA